MRSTLLFVWLTLLGTASFAQLATPTRPGAVKVGTNLSAAPDGTLSVTGLQGQIASLSSTAGTTTTQLTTAIASIGSLSTSVGTNTTNIASLSVTVAANTTAINGKVPTSRMLTINGVPLDLSADRSWTIAGGGGTTTDAASLTTGTVNDARLSVNIQRSYDNVSVLRTVTPADGTLAFTEGYYASGDGGMAQYMYSASSTAADDSAFTIKPTAVSGSGRWVYLVPMTRIVNVRSVGAKGDGSTDDTWPLQRAINYVIDRALKWYAPTGAYKLTYKLRFGQTSPASFPADQTNCEFYGDGIFRDPNNTTSNYKGTLFLLTGTGHSAIFEVNKGAYAFNHFRDFTLKAATKLGATDGLSWSSTGFTQHNVTRVHVVDVKKAYAVRTGGMANGEFITFTKCSGDGSENFFYMDGVGLSGQSFGHKFDHCIGSVEDGGAIFEVGGGNGGYNLTANECEMSLHYNRTPGDPMNIDEKFQTWTAGATYLKNSGVTGTLTFIGGRCETINTIVNTVQSAYNQNGRIKFEGITFDGMSSLLTRPSLKSTGTNSSYGYIFESCYFTGFNQATTGASWRTDLGTGDASKYTFNRCSFSGFRSYSDATGRDNGASLEYNFVSRETKQGAHITFSKRYQWRTDVQDAILPGRPDNILLQSGIRTASGTGVQPTAPWSLTGTGTNIDVLFYPDGGLTPHTASPDARQLYIPGNTSLFQDISASVVDFTSSNATVYYRAVFQPGWGNKNYTFTLENSVSGKIYDQVTIRTPPDPQNSDAKMPILLVANDGATTGQLRVRIANSGSAGDDGAMRLHRQWLSTSPNAAFVPTTTTAVSYSHIWGANIETGRFTSRLQIPAKTDVFGSANAALDQAPGEMYFSLTTGTIKYRDANGWQEISLNSTKPTTITASTYANAQTAVAALPAGVAALVTVTADESPDNAGTGAGGANPTTYYVYWPGTGLKQLLTY